MAISPIAIITNPIGHKPVIKKITLIPNSHLYISIFLISFFGGDFLFKRIISLLLVIATILSFSVIPSYAANSFESTYFWHYFTLQFAFKDLPDFWKSIFSSDDPAMAYSSEISTLQSDLGTSVIGPDSLLLPVPVVKVSGYSSGSFSISGSYFTSVNPFLNEADVLYTSNFQAPYAGYYTPVITHSVGGAAVFGRMQGILISGRTSCSAGAYLTSNSSSVTPYMVFTGSSTEFGTCSGSLYFLCEPTAGISGLTTMDVTPSSRVGVLTGSYSSGDNIYENVTIVNESEKTFYDPTTGTTFTYDHFTYDYATRTYTLYDADGNVIAVITYGDDQLTISQGGTDTPLNYAVPSDSGNTDDGSSGDSDSSIGFFAALGDFLADGVDWIVDKLNQLVESISGILDTFNQYVVDLSGKAGMFPAFLTAAIACVPSDLMSLLWVSIVFIVIAAVWKKWFS